MSPPVEYLPGFISEPGQVLLSLREQVSWDLRMRARQTASMGEPYNYSGLEYPPAVWHPWVAEVRSRLATRFGGAPNNCLLNFYPTGSSKMGWHSDDVSILEGDTGVAIVSLGIVRPLAFRRRGESTLATYEQLLEPGSLLFMPGHMQSEWQHSLPPTAAQEARMSLTFRRLVAARGATASPRVDG